MLANLLEEKGFETMILPHDGYHYPLDYLRNFPKADELVYRRGAPGESVILIYLLLFIG